MPKELFVTALNIRSLNLNNSNIFTHKLNYLLSINCDILILLEINTQTIDWDSAAQKIYRFELRNHNYFITEPEPGYSTKRGILFLYKKSLGLTINNITQVNFNLVKMELEHPELKLIIYGVYADSDMDNPEYFLEIRKLTLEDNCSHILITGDFNTTRCTVKDRWNYTSDNHKKSRTVIQNWID